MGIFVYAFLANTVLTKNRPTDEHRFQLKYGTRDGALHDLWQDPFGLYTTLLVGINPEQGFFVAADPVLHNPTRMFISIEFKEAQVDALLKTGWHTWERDRLDDERPVEILVGGRRDQFLRLIHLEREAVGEDQGHRQLLAEKSDGAEVVVDKGIPAGLLPSPTLPRLHALAREFEMDEAEVLDLIAKTRRLKMAVRGWVAEQHLVRTLASVPGVSECARLDGEGGPDVTLRFEGSRPLSVECKNVLRQQAADGAIRLDFQRTRASLGDPCSRYYAASDFDIVAACLHSVTEKWEFRYVRSASMGSHKKCPGKLASNVRLDEAWKQDAAKVLRSAAEL
jgi:hypothetical protein